jgi:hypothetical protein
MSPESWIKIRQVLIIPQRILPFTIEVQRDCSAMENPYLSSDESIVLTTQNVVVDGNRHEAVLTSRRLILIRSDDAKSPGREILLSAIGSAIAGENPLREPTITLTLTSPEGVLNTLQMVFIRLVPGVDDRQYDEWVAQLKERIRLTVPEPAEVSLPPVKPLPDSGPSQTAEAPPAATSPAVPAGAATASEEPPSPPGPAGPAPGSSPAKVAIIVIVIAALAIAAYAGIGMLPAAAPSGTETPAPPAETPPPVTPAETTPLSPDLTTAAGTPETTTPPVTPDPVLAIPSSGVWVLVDYPGRYTGSIGTSGRMRDIAGTGDRFFQLYESSGVVTAEIQKAEKNGERINVILYKNGAEIRRVNTTAPGGTVYLNIGI